MTILEKIETLRWDLVSDPYIWSDAYAKRRAKLAKLVRAWRKNNSLRSVR